MPDDLGIKRPLDSERINVNQDHEVDYWTDKLDVTEKELRKAVDQVGTSVDEVEKYLGK